MKIQISAFVLLLVIAYSFVSCDDNDVNPSGLGTLAIEFDSHAGEKDLVLNDTYQTSSGEYFSPSKFNYYVSNIKLRTTEGKEFVLPQDSSYFLIQENEASQTVTLNNIPSGDYNEITFTIGVDSLRNTMDISKRTGVLDPAQGHDGMYWTWNSGYIFFKLEGRSPSSPNQDNKFYYHIGGFGGYDAPTVNNIRQKTIDLEDARAEVRSNRSPKVHLRVDVLKVFEAPNQFKIADYSLVMFSAFSRKISENYTNMFIYDHVHN